MSSISSDIGITTLRAGISQLQTSADRNTQLMAAHLGSCLGVAIYHPQSGLGAMLHSLLPLSQKDPEKARAKPLMFVDTGLTEAFGVFGARGIPLRELQIYVAGGANINDENNVFQIGQKNYTVFKKLLWKNKLLVKGEHIGGSIARTISLDLRDGRVRVRAGDDTIEL